MGFPVGYTDLYLPNLLVYLLTFLGFIRKFIGAVLTLFGFGDFLEPETAPYSPRVESVSEPRSMAAALIREMLPVVSFSDLAQGGDLELPESCAVCLYEFDGEDEIRRLANCRHIFHRGCLDRWMDHDQKTCPLCRTQFVPEDMQEAFNEKLWLASGILDFHGDYSPITAGL
ncbi:brassinosteroid-responsive RING-H2 [Striga hermonthica]|uniref:Brassinosteroid-responsive RING-H2 n=1 Tax=Striga hermonthica TaxID=68872 RepID=A0A9N7N1S8_STRHE|nr:brassinosteroid-responsive RING-H2 [Striga hermonthica]